MTLVHGAVGQDAFEVRPGCFSEGVQVDGLPLGWHGVLSSDGGELRPEAINELGG